MGEIQSNLATTANSLSQATPFISNVMSGSTLWATGAWLASNTTSALTTAGTGASVSLGNTAWTNPSNVTSVNVNFATCAASATDLLVGTNFGFSIPAGAVIANVTVSCYAKVNTASGSPKIVTVELRYNGAILGSAQSPSQGITTGSTQYSFGPSAWGTTTSTLTPAVVNSSTFGFGIACSASTSKTFSVDGFQMTITYSYLPTTTVSDGANTWNKVADNWTTGWSSSLWVCKNAVGGATTPTFSLASGSGTPTAIALLVAETPQFTTTQQDVNAATINGSATAPTLAPSMTPTANGDLVYCSCILPIAGGGRTGNPVAGTGADGGGGSVTWGTPSGVTGSSSFATAAMTTGVTSNWLVGTNFGFSVPTGAIIVGLICNFAIKAGTSGLSTINQVTLWSGGVPIGTAKTPGTNITTTASGYSFGNSIDQFSAGLTPAIVNSSGFGFAINVAGTGTVTVSAQQFNIQIWYFPDATSTNLSFMTIGSNGITATNSASGTSWNAVAAYDAVGTQGVAAAIQAGFSFNFTVGLVNGNGPAIQAATLFSAPSTRRQRGWGF